jgi:WD40 repeat protein
MTLKWPLLGYFLRKKTAGKRENMRKIPAVILLVLSACAKSPIVTKEITTPATVPIPTSMANPDPIATASSELALQPSISPANPKDTLEVITQSNIGDLQEITTWWGLNAEDMDSSNDGSLFAVNQYPKGVFFYDPETAVVNPQASGSAHSAPQGGEILRVAENSDVTFISLSADGLFLATGSLLKDFPNYLRLWDASNGKELWSREIKGGMTQQLRLSPDDRFVAMMSIDLPNFDNPKLRLWNITDGSLVLDQSCPAVAALAFSIDGSTIITENDRGDIFFVRIADGKIEKQLQGHTAIPLSFIYSPDARKFVSGSIDGMLIIWELPDYQPLHTINLGYMLQSFAFLPDSSILISASGGGLSFIDISNGEIIRTIDTEFLVRDVVVLNHGRIIASRSANGFITFWGIPKV